MQVKQSISFTTAGVPITWFGRRLFRIDVYKKFKNVNLNCRALGKKMHENHEHIIKMQNIFSFSASPKYGHIKAMKRPEIFRQQPKPQT